MKELKIELQVKPLSANKMYWRGKRSKTSEYLAYQNEIRDELMGTTWPFSDSPLHFVFDVGLSARQADLDGRGLNVLSRSACLADRPTSNTKWSGESLKGHVVPISSSRISFW